MSLIATIGGVLVRRSTSGFDADAQAFFNALTTAGVTLTTTQQNAVNALVIELKAKSLWTRMDVLYPMVGGTSVAHSFNLINPALYQLTYVGSLTHDANGMTPAGGFAQTGFTQVSARLNDNHISYYTRETSTPGKNALMGGCDTASLNNGLYMHIDQSDNSWYVKNYRAGGSSDKIANQITQGANPGFGGLFVNCRIDAGGYYLYRKGIGLFGVAGYINSLPSSGIFTGTFQLGGINGTTGGQGTWNCAFASIGWGLNATQNTDLHNAVQTYQTTLGRQV